MYQLTMNQQFSLPLNRLFDAWKKPELIQKWFAPNGLRVEKVEMDFQTGGKYRIVLAMPDGNQMIVGGTYLEIKEMQRLVFSWQWESSPNTTKVEVDFKSMNGNSSQLTLTHSEFLSEGEENQHHQGWTDMISQLLDLLGT